MSYLAIIPSTGRAQCPARALRGTTLQTAPADLTPQEENARFLAFIQSENDRLTSKSRRSAALAGAIS